MIFRKKTPKPYAKFCPKCGQAVVVNVDYRRFDEQTGVLVEEAYSTRCPDFLWGSSPYESPNGHYHRYGREA